MILLISPPIIHENPFILKMIYLYHLLSFLLLPAYVPFLLIRTFKGKEMPDRVLERFGFSRLKRPEGKLIWFHAASIGEATATLSLVNAINLTSPDVHFLITTGTRSSAEMLASKMPQKAIHQFLPIDNILCVKTFLHRWKPDVGIFIESEIWPCIITEARGFCPLLLMNARLSDNAYLNWQRFPSFFQDCLASFSRVIVQSEIDLEKYRNLGVRKAENLGNIKFGNKKLEVKTEELLALSEHLRGRDVVVAASTHAEDEAEFLPLIADIKKEYPNSYFIMVPRHPARRDEIATSCNSYGLKATFRSQSKLPNLGDDLYITDTFGELGLFYSLCNIAFVGGSFAQGGHSPVEPAHFGKLIIFGPDMNKTQEIATEMVTMKAALQIQNSAELKSRLEYFLSDSSHTEVQRYQTAAINFVARHKDVLQNYLAVIEQYLK